MWLVSTKRGLGRMCCLSLGLKPPLAPSVTLRYNSSVQMQSAPASQPILGDQMDQRVPGLDEEGASAAIGRASDQEAARVRATPRDEGLLTGWEQFHADVLGSRRSVQPLAGLLLSGLLGLVGWLTFAYAPGAFERAKQAHGADPSGVITVEAGYATIIIVALIALAVAFEPFLSRFLGNRRDALRKGLGKSHAALRFPVSALSAAIGFIWQLPSIVLSFIDFILARPIAWLVGVTQEGWRRRYAWGTAVIFASIAAGLYAPAPWGLYAAIAGLIAIFAIVRRWSWSEADRETFLVERCIRPGAMRVGVNEDLRDEALIAITFLFVLIPICLRQIQLATCGEGTCAFTLEGGATLPPDVLGQFVAWLGYFGAELAKSVPFVDWSEVFHVANDSPIEPRTPFGAQIVFAMRAALDLLLLAAVLQAVQIASRLRDQWTAFGASRLPILEPHTERRLFKSTIEAIVPCLEQNPAQQHAITSFPAYADTRLMEVIQDRSGKMAVEVRMTAVALLASQHASEATDQFLTEQEQAERTPEVRDWIVHIAAGVTRERDPIDHEADRARLKALLVDRFDAPAIRAAAARRLARMPHDATTTALLRERLAAPKESIEVRAASALALARHRPQDMRGEIETLASAFGGDLSVDRITAAMTTAHALTRCAPGGDTQAVASAFAEPLRELAVAAARIQAEPIGIDAAKAREAGPALNQMVRIAPGEGQFKPTFTLGSGDDDDLAFPDEKPPKQITMMRPYAIGRYAVTQEEYRVFTAAKGLKPLQYASNKRWPAIEVNWRDTMDYCRWLEAVTGDAYRLPSDVEWEYACRAGTETRWSWGDDLDQAKAASVESRSGKGPMPVESYDPNDWGLWQMHGNVFEWCGDPWHANHGGRPEGQETWNVGGDYGRRVVRGGSWDGASQNSRSAYRFGSATGLRINYLGFRLARTLNP